MTTPSVGGGARPTPTEALRQLIAGNARFAAGAPARPNQGVVRREELAGGQEPFASIVGCADSRVPAEIVFDQGLGDLFVCRTAGHIVGQSVLGSVEFAVEYLHTPLVVVLGHDGCGAVKAALDVVTGTYVPQPNVRELVQRILPAAIAANHSGGTDEEIQHKAVLDNVRHTVENIPQRSKLIADAIVAGNLRVVGAVYDVTTGEAMFLE